MPNWSGMILTKKGLNLQAKVEAGVTLNFTKMKVGDGILGPGQTLENLSDLISPKQTLGITGITPQNGGLCKISSLVTNIGLENGYYVREVGLFAADPDLGEILYAVSTDSSPDYLPPEGGSVVVNEQLDIYVGIGNASSITAQVDAAGLVTNQVLNNHNNDPNAHGKLTSLHLWQPEKAYTVGDICYSLTQASYKRFECVVAGTSGANEPAWPAVGQLKTDGTVTWIVDDIGDGLAPGDIILSPMQRAGRIKCNGALLNRADFPRLFRLAQQTGLVVTEAAWTSGKQGLFSSGDGVNTFRVPELRGEFLRANDDSRGVDTDRVSGTSQDSQNKKHKHLNGLPYGQSSRVFYGLGNPGSSLSSSIQDNITTTSQSPYTSEEGGSEARPQNVSYPAWIRY